MSTSNPIIITQTEAASSDWYRTPALSTLGVPYTVTGVNTSGDSVTISVSNDPALDAALTDQSRMISNGSTGQGATSDSQAGTSFSLVINGTWKWWKVTKTGTAGTSVVQMR